jgi:hypothetical protein
MLLEGGGHEEIRYITLPQEKQKLPKNTKKIVSKNVSTVVSQKKTRIITDTKKWKSMMISTNIQDASFQSHVLQDPSYTSLLESQINYKLRGYKSQDMEKGRFIFDHFVDYNYVLNLLKTEGIGGCCYYCKEPVMLLYESVREPKQWTLERIDNSLGHNRGNVQIACLNCNLRRRTMFQERYVMTKQMTKITKID